jgi:hypothetical protein
VIAVIFPCRVIYLGLNYHNPPDRSLHGVDIYNDTHPAGYILALAYDYPQIAPLSPILPSLPKKKNCAVMPPPTMAVPTKPNDR